MPQEHELDEAVRRRLNIVRFGLMVIPPIAWAISFSLPFIVARGLGANWISLALIPSLIQTAIVAVICIITWFVYKGVVTRRARR
ncbi:MAG: hypothetical protein ACP5TV_10350 [Anaerolineae bacterium]